MTATAKSLKHKFASGVSDGADATQVRPSNWNDDHNFLLGTDARTTTSETINDSDSWSLITFSNTSAVAVTIAQAGTAGNFAAGWVGFAKNVNTGEVTITPTTSTINGKTSLALAEGEYATIISDGTNYIAFVGMGALFAAPEVSVASATTTDIGTSNSARVAITGSTTITGLGSSPDRIRFVRFSGALTLTYNSTSLILPGAANITTAAGDTGIFQSDSSGNWRCLSYQAAASAPVGTSGTLTHGGPVAVTSNSASALALGRQGATNPAISVDASAGSSVTGVKVAAQASGGNANISATSSATNEGLTVDAKGSGQLYLQDAGGTGNIVVGRQIDASAATAGQFKFPSSQNASSDANTLDDYVEGTFTPVLNFGGVNTGVTYSAQIGRYQKIGKRVKFTIIIFLTNNGSGTGAATITGLPYASANVTNLYHPVIGSVNSGTSAGAIASFIAPNTSTITLSDKNFSAYSDTTINDTANLIIGGEYETAN